MCSRRIDPKVFDAARARAEAERRAAYDRVFAALGRAFAIRRPKAATHAASDPCLA